MPDPDAVSAEVRAWYDGYVATFAGLARGESADLEPLVDFCAIPLTVIMDNRYLAIADRSAARSLLGNQVEQLRRAKYARTVIHRLEVRALNERAALIEGAFSRHDDQGNEFARLGAAYLAARTDGGWRFAALIITGA
jgi:NTF2-like protein (DUF6841)